MKGKDSKHSINKIFGLSAILACSALIWVRQKNSKVQNN
jgi:hypothetical protein